jgi:ubiquinone/menaquinone biosynthesis C-methylase UbiE
MGLYRDQVLPRAIDVLLSGRDFEEVRSRTAADLEGEVLEVGFGSGRNVPHYPSKVDRVRALDPAALGRRLAASRLSASPVPVEFVELGADGSYPLPDASVDHVLVTWTLCTIPDVEDALIEMSRVLRPGGRLHFAEHGRSPDPGVARWQDRLTPVQRTIAGGCHLNRPIDRLVAGAGFEHVRLSRSYLPGPKFMTHTFEGTARRA